MNDTNRGMDIKDAIQRLEIKQAEESKELKDQFHAAYESIRPINIIKSTFRNVVASDELQHDILNTSIGLATGYILKKIFIRRSTSPVKKLLGTALMVGVTNVITKNPEVVRSVGGGLIRSIRNKLMKRRHNLSVGENKNIDF